MSNPTQKQLSEAEQLLQNFNMIQSRMNLITTMNNWNAEMGTNYSNPQEFLLHASSDWTQYVNDAEMTKVYSDEQRVKNQILQEQINRREL